MTFAITSKVERCVRCATQGEGLASNPEWDNRKVGLLVWVNAVLAFALETRLAQRHGVPGRYQVTWCRGPVVGDTELAPACI